MSAVAAHHAVGAVYVIDIPEKWFANRGIDWRGSHAGLFDWIARVTGRHVSAEFVKLVLVGKGTRELHRDPLPDRGVIRYAFVA